MTIIGSLDSGAGSSVGVSYGEIGGGFWHQDFCAQSSEGSQNAHIKALSGTSLLDSASNSKRAVTLSTVVNELERGMNALALVAAANEKNVSTQKTAMSMDFSVFILLDDRLQLLAQSKWSLSFDTSFGIYDVTNSFCGIHREVPICH